MRGTWVRVRGGIAAVVCGTVLAGTAAGCAQTVPGTPYAEGESPPAASAGAGDEPASGAEPGTPEPTSSPPTSFSVPGALPSGRPTVTVQPMPGTPTTRYPMPLDDPPSGQQAPPDLQAPLAPTAVIDPPDVAGQLRRTVVPQRPRTATPEQGSRAAAAPAPPAAAPRPNAAGPSAPGPSAPGPNAPRPATPRPASPGPGVPNAAAPGSGGSGPTPGAAGPLTSDVVPDECLLDARGFGALLGASVPAPANHVVTRPGGATTRSCFAVATSGSPAPTASVNVYRVNTGTPVAFLRTATGSRPLTGVGDGAVLVDTVGGPTLQIATPTLLVTIAAAGRTPTDDAWRTAGRAAVASLPRR
ncbi:hypothetical protein [Pseudonocardia sediminis]|uniref:hypothetical protein n=1 Tax=Pseudonocardia sediminis TaxID=1397368 RepID=UPI0010289F57|nr:hypothetical protein [Pseudonocardia sediminis]